MNTTAPPLIPSTGVGDLRRQQTAFCALTLLVLALLLGLHTLFASILGEPSLWLILLLGLGFSLKAGELVWLQSLNGVLTERAAKLENGISIGAMFAITALLAYLTNRDDSPYFALLAIPILQCAYMCGILATVLTVVVQRIRVPAFPDLFLNPDLVLIGLQPCYRPVEVRIIGG